MPHSIQFNFLFFSSFGFQFIDPFFFIKVPDSTVSQKYHSFSFSGLSPLYKPPLHISFCHHYFPFSISYIHTSDYSITVFRMSCRPGDWNCRSCQHMNFQRRESCQRCGESKYGEYVGGGRSGGGSCSFGMMSNIGSDVRPGDWYCAANNCGTHNFASRSSCFKCGAFKDDLLSSSFNNDFLLRSRPFASAPTRPSWKSGDWICNRSGCNEHNFASRMECFKCSAPRDTY